MNEYNHGASFAARVTYLFSVVGNESIFCSFDDDKMVPPFDDDKMVPPSMTSFPHMMTLACRRRKIIHFI